jgi:hypothetical protein
MQDDTLQEGASTATASDDPVDPTESTPEAEAEAPQPQAGGGSPVPPTAPAPPPGVPAKPVNAERSDTDPVPAILQPSRIGEAIAQQHQVEAAAKLA